MDGLWAALAFLTVVPVPARWAGDASGAPRRMLWWWGVAGVLIGGLAAGVVWLATWRLPWVACSAIGVVTLIGLSGGLHLDGFVDTCDGLGSRAPRARALAIMKDSHAGAFGVIGAISLVLVKFGLVAGLGAHWGVAAIGAAPVVGRLVQVWVLRGSRYARPEGGLGSAFFSAASNRHMVVAALFAAGTAYAWLNLAGLAALAGSFAVTALGAVGVARRLGGHTGDTVGALSEIAETTFCLALALIVGT
jgi:adenosylcobinamide-GDP ribazoletransferase